MFEIILYSLLGFFTFFVIYIFIIFLNNFVIIYHFNNRDKLINFINLNCLWNVYYISVCDKKQAGVLVEDKFND